MFWWGGVLIHSLVRTQITIATSSAESEYYGVCACASEAVYVKELLKFLGPRRGGSDRAIKLVKVKGTQHPPDVGTKYLSKQGMIHAKTMLGLMEPESLAAFGYEIPDSTGVRDKLEKTSSIMVASIGIASLMSGRKLESSSS
eukprot:1375712-Amphidinium_carterae.2